jgi:SPP1 gp7 family putative phage head morphogenesis protein
VITYPQGTEKVLARELAARTRALRSLLRKRLQEVLARPGVTAAEIHDVIEATRRTLRSMPSPSLSARAATALGIEAGVRRELVAMVRKATGQDLAKDSRVVVAQALAEGRRLVWAQRLLEEQLRIEGELFDRASRKAAEAAQRGRLDLVAEVVEEQAAQTERRLHGLARHEVGNWVAEVTATHCRALGIRRYRWLSEKDERVRELHRKLDGTVRSWDDPHPTEGHPGQARGCRCTAQPVVEDLRSPEPAAAPRRRPVPEGLPAVWRPPAQPQGPRRRAPGRRRASTPGTPPALLPGRLPRDPGLLAGASPPGGSGGPPPGAPPAPPAPPSSPPTPPSPPAPPSPPSFDLSRVRHLSINPKAKERTARLRAIFGRDVSTDEILSWAGVRPEDLDGAPSLRLAIVGEEVNLTVETAAYKVDRIYKKSATGGLLAQHESLEVFETGKGLGARIFARQVDTLRAAGFKRIDTFAAGSYGDEEFNGYWTWAVFGFDAKLPTRIASKLPPELAEAKSVSDLMASAEGQTWWKINGKGLDMSFDLDPNSRSSQKLDLYLAAKGIRRDAEEIDLDAEDERLLLEAALEQARREREEAERRKREQDVA